MALHSLIKKVTGAGLKANQHWGVASSCARFYVCFVA